MNRLISFIKKHPVVFLIILIAGTACIVYNYYLFRGYVFLFQDIGSDTKEQYVMWYNTIVNHVQGGDFSFWNLNYNFGTSMFTMNLFHPTLWLVYLSGILFGAEHIASVLIYLHILHIILAGAACYYFLSSFRISTFSKVLAAYIYSFNGFITVWGQHYQFGIILFFLPMLLALLERSLRSCDLNVTPPYEKSVKSTLCIPAVSGLMVLSSYYLSYMVFLICALYLFLRLILIRTGSFAQKVRLFFSRGLLLFLGLLLGMVNLLPSYMLVSNTSARLNAGGGILERFLAYFTAYPKEYYTTFFKRLFSSSLEGVGYTATDYTGYANYYEAPNLFFTCLLMILFIQFLFLLPKIVNTGRKRIVCALSAAFLIVFCFVQSGSLVFNAFAYPFSRDTFLLMPFFALLCGYMLDRIRKEKIFSWIGGGIAALLCLYVYGTSFPHMTSGTLKLAVILLAVSAVFLVFVLGCFRRENPPKKQLLCMTALLLLLVVQSASDAYTTVAGRATVKKGSEYFEDLYGTDYQSLSAYLAAEDPDLYRVEKDFTAGSSCMDALGQNYNGISGYNSTMNKYTLDFVAEVAPELEYANTSHVAFVNAADDEMLAELFGIRYIISDRADIERSPYRMVRQFGDLYLYENERCTFAHYYPDAITAGNYEELRMQYTPSEILSDYIVLADENITLPSEATLIDDYSSYENAAAELTLTDSGRDGYITCKCNATEDGYLLFPVTYEDGWTLRVDGAEQPLYRADYAFIAAGITSGAHTVELIYQVPWLKEGLIVSLAGLVLYVFLILLVILRNRQKTAKSRKNA